MIFVKGLKLMPKSLYIHIPFCKSRCKYCSFVSTTKTSLIEEYVNALCRQIKFQYKGELLRTLYIGGGTPSVLAVKDIEKILNLLKFNGSTEVTIECNPSDLDTNYLKELKYLGVNRLSLGVQAFDDELLKMIGRRHNVQKAEDAVKMVKASGFDNINIDLIYGLPSQDLARYEKTLEKALAQEVQHISLYGLKIEEGCYFYKHYPQNLPDDEVQAQMHKLSKQILEEHGFIHYEISNFAKQGFSSRHNLNYWEAKEYYGFGTAAHGYIDKVRYANTSNIESYIQNPLMLSDIHFLSAQERLEETIFLGFRKFDGIDVETINAEFGIDFEDKYKKILQKYSNLKHIEKTAKGYKLTEEGILLSNYFLSEFLM